MDSFVHEGVVVPAISVERMDEINEFCSKQFPKILTHTYGQLIAARSIFNMLDLEEFGFTEFITPPGLDIKVWGATPSRRLLVIKLATLNVVIDEDENAWLEREGGKQCSSITNLRDLHYLKKIVVEIIKCHSNQHGF